MTSAIGHQGTTSKWTVDTGLLPVNSGESRCERILCVGTRTEQLFEIQLQLDCDADFVMAAHAAEGLAALAVEAPFDIIITCLEAFETQVGSFHEALRRHSPDAERLVIVPRMDAKARAAAANDARVMRLLPAPCPTRLIREAVADALLRHRARVLRATMIPKATPPGGNPCAGY